MKAVYDDFAALRSTFLGREQAFDPKAELRAGDDAIWAF
jgi:hypothetical protein